MKRKLSLCLSIVALTLLSTAAFAQDMKKDAPKSRNPQDTVGRKKGPGPAAPKDTLYHRKPYVTPNDTVKRTKITKPQPGTKTNGSAKPK